MKRHRFPLVLMLIALVISFIGCQAPETQVTGTVNVTVDIKGYEGYDKVVIWGTDSSGNPGPESINLEPSVDSGTLVLPAGEWIIQASVMKGSTEIASSSTAVKVIPNTTVNAEIKLHKESKPAPVEPGFKVTAERPELITRDAVEVKADVPEGVETVNWYINGELKVRYKGKSVWISGFDLKLGDNAIKASYSKADGSKIESNEVILKLKESLDMSIEYKLNPEGKPAVTFSAVYLMTDASKAELLAKNPTYVWKVGMGDIPTAYNRVIKTGNVDSAEYVLEKTSAPIVGGNIQVLDSEGNLLYNGYNAMMSLFDSFIKLPGTIKQGEQFTAEFSSQVLEPNEKWSFKWSLDGQPVENGTVKSIALTVNDANEHTLILDIEYGSYTLSLDTTFTAEGGVPVEPDPLAPKFNWNGIFDLTFNSRMYIDLIDWNSSYSYYMLLDGNKTDLKGSFTQFECSGIGYGEHQVRIGVVIDGKNHETETMILKVVEGVNVDFEARTPDGINTAVATLSMKDDNPHKDKPLTYKWRFATSSETITTEVPEVAVPVGCIDGFYIPYEVDVYDGSELLFSARAENRIAVFGEDVPVEIKVPSVGSIDQKVSVVTPYMNTSKLTYEWKSSNSKLNITSNGVYATLTLSSADIGNCGVGVRITNESGEWIERWFELIVQEEETKVPEEDYAGPFNIVVSPAPDVKGIREMVRDQNFRLTEFDESMTYKWYMDDLSCKLQYFEHGGHYYVNVPETASFGMHKLIGIADPGNGQKKYRNEYDFNVKSRIDAVVDDSKFPVITLKAVLEDDAPVNENLSYNWNLRFGMGNVLIEKIGQEISVEFPEKGDHYLYWSISVDDDRFIGSNSLHEIERESIVGDGVLEVPKDGTVEASYQFQFENDLLNYDNYNYEWKVDGQIIEGQTTRNLTYSFGNKASYKIEVTATPKNFEYASMIVETFVETKIVDVPVEPDPLAPQCSMNIKRPLPLYSDLLVELRDMNTSYSYYLRLGDRRIPLNGMYNYISCTEFGYGTHEFVIGVTIGGVDHETRPSTFEVVEGVSIRFECRTPDNINTAVAKVAMKDDNIHRNSNLTYKWKFEDSSRVFESEEPEIKIPTDIGLDTLCIYAEVEVYDGTEMIFSNRLVKFFYWYADDHDTIIKVPDKGTVRSDFVLDSPYFKPENFTYTYEVSDGIAYEVSDNVLSLGLSAENEGYITVYSHVEDNRSHEYVDVWFDLKIEIDNTAFEPAGFDFNVTGMEGASYYMFALDEEALVKLDAMTFTRDVDPETLHSARIEAYDSHDRLIGSWSADKLQVKVEERLPVAAKVAPLDVFGSVDLNIKNVIEPLEGGDDWLTPVSYRIKVTSVNDAFERTVEDISKPVAVDKLYKNEAYTIKVDALNGKGAVIGTAILSAKAGDAAKNVVIKELTDDGTLEVSVAGVNVSAEVSCSYGSSTVPMKFVEGTWTGTLNVAPGKGTVTVTVNGIKKTIPTRIVSGHPSKVSVSYTGIDLTIKNEIVTTPEIKITVDKDFDSTTREIVLMAEVAGYPNAAFTWHTIAGDSFIGSKITWKVPDWNQKYYVINVVTNCGGRNASKSYKLEVPGV